MSSTTTNLATRYTSRRHDDDRHFVKYQPYRTEGINHLYGTQWRSYASNVREVPQEDGTLVTGSEGLSHSRIHSEDLSLEYTFQNPSAARNARASPVISSDEDYQSPRSKFAQIKAKFESKAPVPVMASPPPPSSSHSSEKNSARGDSYRRSSAERIQLTPGQSLSTSTSDRSQSTQSERSTTGSSRYLHSVDETDEELQHFHQQGR